ncbi:4030_t:CDS:2 [Paraglomus brasilianum]|uniref:4030_t:CDS:1 n=1 Tax=Paraglomus brasilianum TaxID=144538 RepID=A0A9N9APM4_9GLOM|nr:4030_t:CDS:2 [Paraglomus brasilianum]
MTDLLEEFDSTFEVYGIEKTSESTNAGNTEIAHDESEDHTALKIELKDILDNLRDVLHLKKKDLEGIFTVGIQVNRYRWVIYSMTYDPSTNFYYFNEMMVLVIPKTPSEMGYLLVDFIKGLLGLRHTLLWLNGKLTQLAKQKYSTPSPGSSPLPETSETPAVKRVKNNVFVI